MKHFLAGLGIGALVGILAAPARGALTRERLALRWDDITSESPNHAEKSNNPTNWNENHSITSFSPIVDELIS